jgi:hypothetical protein
LEQIIAGIDDDLEKSLEMVNKWMKQSGLKVNVIKTKLSLFQCLPHVLALP